MPDQITLMGINHKTAPVELRETLSFSREETDQMLRELNAIPGINESMMFSTCNRTEVLVIIRSRNTGAFIGWHGQTLDAVELLLNAIVSQHLGLRLDITADIDQYRRKRASFLEALVKRTVREIEHDHTERPLRGLLPKERRYVHTLMADHPYLTTESRGRGGKRTLFITPRKEFAAGETEDGGE